MYSISSRRSFVPHALISLRKLRLKLLLSSKVSLLTVIPESSLSMETVRELEQLPHVASVTAQWEANINALVDSVGTYLLTVNLDNPQLWQYHPELNPGDYFPDAQLDGWTENQASQTHGLEQDGCFRSSSKPSPSDKPDHYDYFTENDQFSVGAILPLVQVYSGSDSDNLMSALFTSTRATASPRIDGLLTGVPYGSFDIPAVVTTPEGLQSLGLRCDNTTNIQINLDGPVDRATEDTLRDRIQRIAAREDGLVVMEQMPSSRHSASVHRTLAFRWFKSLLLNPPKNAIFDRMHPLLRLGGAFSVQRGAEAF